MEKVIVNPIFKDTVTFVKTSSESSGKISDMEITLLPGGKNPLHYHKSYSETFTAIDGDLGLGIRKREEENPQAGKHIHG